LLAGELKHQEQGGVCWRFNVDILPNLPKTLPNSYIISAKDCESTGDQFHFSTEGMRTLGYRYAEQMLKLHKYKMKKRPSKIKIEEGLTDRGFSTSVPGTPGNGLY
jgi:hypothetical protein